MRVLVCGGRDYHNQEHVSVVLDALHTKNPITCLIEGGAKGADMCAQIWSQRREIASECYRAHWHLLGRGAGMVRNQKMIDEGKPDLVVAFPGGKGTADMVRRARSYSIRVIEIADAPATAEA